MIKKIKKKVIRRVVECPKCLLKAQIEIRKFCKFVIYICPKCKSNIAYYNNKVSIISNRMLNSLKKQKRLEVCGNALFPVKTKHKSNITKDDIINLQILLETEKDFNSFLKKI